MIINLLTESNKFRFEPKIQKFDLLIFLWINSNFPILKSGHCYLTSRHLPSSTTGRHPKISHKRSLERRWNIELSEDVIRKRGFAWTGWSRNPIVIAMDAIARTIIAVIIPSTRTGFVLQRFPSIDTIVYWITVVFAGFQACNPDFTVICVIRIIATVLLVFAWACFFSESRGALVQLGETGTVRSWEFCVFRDFVFLGCVDLLGEI